MKGLPAKARLLVLGSGPLESELRQISARLCLEPRVHFLGFQSAVKRWMQAADGFVLSSRYEGLPMVLLEAGACELPSVAADVAGTQEVIVHGETGLLARPGDPGALNSAMTALMHMPQKERRAMGKCARRRVVELFSMSAVLDRWEELYTELLERSASRSIRLIAREAFTRASATSA